MSTIPPGSKCEGPPPASSGLPSDAGAPSERLARRLITGCALASGVGALLSILVRMGDLRWEWATRVRPYYGMAIHTATLLLLLSAGLFVHNRWPDRRRGRAFGGLMVFLAGGLALAVLLRRWFSLPLEFERWLAGLLIPPLQSTVGRMSPHTAGTILLGAGALGCLLRARRPGPGGAGPGAGDAPPWASAPSPGWRWAAFLCAAIAFGSGVMAAVGYLAGAPLLYGPQFTSMKWVAAGTVMVLNLGLMLAAFPRNWLLQGLTGERDDTAGAQSADYRRVVALVLVFLTGGIVIGGVYFLHKEQATLRARVEHELATAADLTAARVTDWRERCLTEANLVMNTPYASRRAMATLSDPQSPWNRRVFTNWLRSFLATGPYQEAVVLDDQLRASLALPPRPDVRLAAAERAAAEQSLNLRQAVMTDLHRSAENSNDIHISLTVPLVVQRDDLTGRLAERRASTGERASVGVLLLRIDARRTLFPLVASRPAGSATAESFLARSEGAEGLYLSELRHQTNAALRMRFSMEPAPNPLVPGGLREERMLRGLDYRNVPVLAAVRRVAGSPWWLVTKVDEKEIYAPVRERTRALSAILAVLLLGAVLGLNLAWRRRDNQFLRQQMAGERERFLLAQRLSHLMKHANDVVIITDGQWRIQEINDLALERYGYTPAEFQRLRLPDLCPRAARPESNNSSPTAPVQSPRSAAEPTAPPPPPPGPARNNGPPAGSPDFSAFEERFRQDGQVVAQTLHQRRDGTVFPVEISARQVELDGASHTLAIVRDITERKQAEDALRRSEDRYRSLVETARDAIFTTTPDGVFTSLNPAFETLTGWPRATWLGKNFADLVHPEDLPLAREMAQRVAGGEPSPLFEVRVRKPQGEPLTVQILATPQVRDGRVESLLGIARDVTLKKRMEAALRESEEKLKLALKASEMGVWDWDLPSQTIFWSPECYGIFGVKEFDGTLEAFTRRVHPADLPRVMAAANQALAAQTQYAAEFRILRPDGQIRWVSNLGQARADATGRPRRLVGTVLDITARKLAEEALRKSEERYRAVVEDQTEVISRFRANGELVFVNDVFCRFFGVTAAGTVGTPWHPRAVAEDIPDIEARLRQLSPAQPVVVIENRVYAADGQVHWMQFVNRGFFDDEGRLMEVQSVGRDVTERKAAEEQLREREARLTQTAEAGNVGLWEWEANGDRAFFSPQWKRQIGYADDEIANRFQEWASRVHPDDLEATLEKIRACVATPGANFQAEFRFRHRNGSYRWILARASVVGGSEGRPARLLGAHLDITELKRLQEQLLEVSDREQARIGQDLHDGLSQLLVSAAFDLTRLGKRLRGRGDAELALVRQAAESVDRALTEARGVARGLFAVHLGGEGLAQALCDLGERVRTRHGIRCSVECPARIAVRNETAAIHLFRIAQEAVNNAVKHGRPDHIAIRLTMDAAQVELTVSDNGGGPSARPEAGGGMGLHIMDYRARALNGSFKIEPLQPRGTRVCCVVPRQQL
jgi:PAS domain S-box-containing protein